MKDLIIQNFPPILGLETDPEETAFAALKKFQKTDFKLVPEHVEARTLTHPEHPELSQV